MFSIRDQENVVHGHQALAASKRMNQTNNRLAPKTPANRFPKTPLKMPLNDENGATGFGKGKSILQTKGKGAENMATGKKTLGTGMDKNSFVTPMGPRTARAPLGQKTTNVKARAFQTPAALGPTKQQSQIRPTSTRPQRQKVRSAPLKIEVRGDSPLNDDCPSPEYCPPPVVLPPYVNDDIDISDLDYTIVHREAQSNDFYLKYHGPLNRRREQEDEEEAQRRMEAAERKIMQLSDDDKCIFSDDSDAPSQPKPAAKPATTRPPLHQRSVSTVRKPLGTTSSGPDTLNSRRAASALAIALRPVASNAPARTTAQNRSVSSGAPLMKKPALPFGLRRTNTTTAVPTDNAIRAATAAAASKSTIGYTKGRSTRTALNMGFGDQSTFASRARTASAAPSSTASSSHPASASASIRNRPGSRTVVGNASTNTTGTKTPRIAGLHRASSHLSSISNRSNESDHHRTVTPANFARKSSAVSDDPFFEGKTVKKLSLMDAFDFSDPESDNDSEASMYEF